MPRPPAGYGESVVSIAREIYEELPDSRRDHNERVDRVHEDVDSSQWIIYTGNHEIVLRDTRNEPDSREVKAMSGPDADWKQMRQTAAFLAMEADVWDEIRKLDEEGADYGDSA